MPPSSEDAPTGAPPGPLFHLSERAGIARFEPRPAPAESPRAGERLVWAVDERHLVNYLLPRDCPRVGFYARDDSLAEEVDALIGPGGAGHVLAIETAWLERARSAVLYRYRFDPAPFRPADPGAGYYVADRAVEPLEEERLSDPFGEMLARGVELRVMPTLWGLRDAVTASTLQFSCIRMRNAAPRDAAP